MSADSGDQIITGIATILIPVVVVWIGQRFAGALRDRELRSRYVELAVDVLKEEPTSEHEALRKWAVELIDRYSEIPLGSEVRKGLAEKPLAQWQKTYYDRYYRDRT